MGFIVAFFIWYNIIGKNSPKIYKALDGKIRGIVTAIIIMSVFTSLIPGFVIGSLVVVMALAFTFGVPVFAITRILKSMGLIKSKEKKSLNSEYDRARYEKEVKTSGNKKKYGNSLTGLTNSYPKRRKIVEKFSKKYSLNLTEKEIDRIVDASYTSYSWEREIYDMTEDYNALSQWYNRDTGWLRAYLRAFPIQSVSSDFDRQREICQDVFTQVFTEINPGRFATIDECVDAINDKYLTAFDEQTFMIAYRFLEANKVHIKLPSHTVLKGDSELDRLMHKYDEETEEGYAAGESTYRNKGVGEKLKI
ncbi:MAG: hypothetical protein NC240_00625 [Clostridium sp.]|nr:hypothetical protein [Clostridium sp.]